MLASTKIPQLSPKTSGKYPNLALFKKYTHKKYTIIHFHNIKIQVRNTS